MAARKDWLVVYAQNGLELVRYADGRRELRLSEAPEVVLPVHVAASADAALDTMLAGVLQDESRRN